MDQLLRVPNKTSSNPLQRCKQLDIAEPSCLLHYRERPVTRHEHATEIQRRHAYRDFHEQPQHFRLVRWLYTRAWVNAERPMVLFDLATARLVKEKILLPGVTTLTRLVASVRDRAAARLWRILAELPSHEQRGRLLSLLRPPREREPLFSSGPNASRTDPNQCHRHVGRASAAFRIQCAPGGGPRSDLCASWAATSLGSLCCSFQGPGD